MGPGGYRSGVYGTGLGVAGVVVSVGLHKLIANSAQDE